MVAGVDTITAGGWTISCLTDGTFTFDDADFPDIAQDLRDARLAAAGLTAPDTEFAAYLLQRDDHAPVLVDAGCGSKFGRHGGELFDRLDLLGVPVTAIETVILTHMHGDHCGGLLALDDTARLPHARVMIHRAEAEFWAPTDTVARLVLDRYDGQIDLVDGGQSPLPGIEVRELFGHTAGHIGLVIGDEVALIGDCVHSEALQLPDPSMRTENDHDHATASATRRALWAELADTGILWSGSHMLGPQKFARLAREGTGYRRVPR